MDRWGLWPNKDTERTDHDPVQKHRRLHLSEDQLTDIETVRLLRQVEVQAKADHMSRAERQRYLRANRWRRINGNTWQDKAGRPYSFGAAVRQQLSRELEAP
jgi:hypothetical protein